MWPYKISKDGIQGVEKPIPPPSPIPSTLERNLESDMKCYQSAGETFSAT